MKGMKKMMLIFDDVVVVVGGVDTVAIIAVCNPEKKNRNMNGLCKMCVI